MEMKMLDFSQKADDFVKGFSKRDVFPFPVDGLAEHKDFTVRVFKPHDKLSNVQGAIDYDNKTIYVSEYDSPTRQRFTIAHELGHLALHSDEGSIVDFREDTTAAQNPREKEANSFAAELLMPKKAFVEQHKSAGGLTRVLGLYFGVSPVAVNFRIRELGLKETV